MPRVGTVIGQATDARPLVFVWRSTKAENQTQLILNLTFGKILRKIKYARQYRCRERADCPNLISRQRYIRRTRSRQCNCKCERPLTHLAADTTKSQPRCCTGAPASQQLYVKFLTCSRYRPKKKIFSTWRGRSPRVSKLLREPADFAVSNRDVTPTSNDSMLNP